MFDKKPAFETDNENADQPMIKESAVSETAQQDADRAPRLPAYVMHG